jgi:hypothetical protein
MILTSLCLAVSIGITGPNCLDRLQDSAEDFEAIYGKPEIQSRTMPTAIFPLKKLSEIKSLTLTRLLQLNPKAEMSSANYIPTGIEMKTSNEPGMHTVCLSVGFRAYKVDSMSLRGTDAGLTWGRLLSTCGADAQLFSATSRPMKGSTSYKLKSADAMLKGWVVTASERPFSSKGVNYLQTDVNFNREKPLETNVEPMTSFDFWTDDTLSGFKMELPISVKTLKDALNAIGMKTGTYVATRVETIDSANPTGRLWTVKAKDKSLQGCELGVFEYKKTFTINLTIERSLMSKRT